MSDPDEILRIVEGVEAKQQQTGLASVARAVPWFCAIARQLIAEREAALNALQMLCDHQNGPPLLTPSAEAGWREAMARAHTVLARKDHP